MSSVAYVEPSWHNQPSPYYSDSHRRFQKKIRSFVNREILPFVGKWDEKGKYPRELRYKAYEAGVYGALWPKEFGGTPPQDLDAFHSLIWHDELARCGSGGLMASLFLPLGWGMLPVLKYGLQPDIKSKETQILKDLITGKKTISLGVSEPKVGSDVNNLETNVIPDPNNENNYILNGEKYFISNGMECDYICAAVKERNTNLKFFILVDTSLKGVYRSKMKTQGWLMGNTTYFVFKNVIINKSYRVGELNKNGFKPILSNFNHGRFAMASTATRYARVCLEDAIRYAQQRKTFGKRLIDHQVIRHKIMEMTRKIESTQALLEQITFFINQKMSDKKLASLMALIKIEASKTMEFCAREASQVLGGRSYLRNGAGARIERLYREVCVMGIAEGATEILNDLVTKQAKL